MSEKFFLGYPDEFQQLCLVYPPKVKDVINEKLYDQYISLLTIRQEDIEDQYLESDKDLSEILTPLEYILSLAFNDAKLAILIKEAFYFFIHEDINFLYDQKSILIGSLQDYKTISNSRILNDDNFFEFQNFIREASGSMKAEKPRKDEPLKIKKMKAKARYRDKIKNKQHGISLSTLLASICCMGFGLNPLNIGELSYASISRLIELYQNKEKYDIDIKSVLAGAGDKIKPEYWIKETNE